MSATYFAHPYLSNSALTAMERELSGQDQHDATEAFAMGSLVDAMITLPGDVNFLTFRVKDRDYQYTREQFAIARKEKVSLMADSLFASIIKQAQPQREFYKEQVHFLCDGLDIWYDCKCMMDLFVPGVMLDCDIKSTVATSQAQFEAACDRFDYDRARVFYSKVAGTRRAIMFGVSKKAPHKVFRVVMNEGDEMWQRGEEKLNRLIKKKYLLGI